MGLFVLLNPFAGLFLIVLLTQLGGFVESILPTYARWVLEAIGVLVLFGAILNAYRRPRHDFLRFKLPVLRLVILFGIAFVLSFLFSEDQNLGMTSMRKYGYLMVLTFLIIYFVDSADRLKAIVLAIIISTAVTGGVAIFQYYGVGLILPEAAEGSLRYVRKTGATASTSNPTSVAHVMTVGVALAAVLTLRLKAWRLGGGVATAVGTIGVILTVSRSAAVLLVFGALWLIYKFRHNPRLPGTLAIVVLLAIVSVPLVPNYYWDRVSTLSEPERDWTFQRRFGYHLVGMDLLVANPILGIGPNNFRKRYTAHEYRYIPGRADEMRALHNLYLSIAVETGLLGFLMFASILVTTLVALSKARRRITDPELGAYAEAVQFAYVIYLISSLGRPADTNKYTWLLIALSVVVALVAHSSQSPDRTRPPRDSLSGTSGV